MDFNKEVFLRQYPVVSLFVQQLAYFRGLKAGLAGRTEYREFWSCTLNNHLKQATVDWCKVFGSPREDLHWAKTPTGNTVGQVRQDFECLVLSYTGFTKQEWEDYRKTMLAMRDKYVAHLDVRNPIEAPVPLFDAALQVAYTYQEWVRKVIKPVVMSSYPLSSEYEMWETEASSIVSRHPHP
jgi:hypothetical protein